MRTVGRWTQQILICYHAQPAIKAIDKLDDFLVSHTDGKRYRFEFQTQTASGELKTHTGVYVIVDGCYLDWRCLQRPHSLTRAHCTSLVKHG